MSKGSIRAAIKYSGFPAGLYCFNTLSTYPCTLAYAGRGHGMPLMLEYELRICLLINLLDLRQMWLAQARMLSCSLLAIWFSQAVVVGEQRVYLIWLRGRA
jgi:hypothetical protein